MTKPVSQHPTTFRRELCGVVEIDQYYGIRVDGKRLYEGFEAIYNLNDTNYHEYSFAGLVTLQITDLSCAHDSTYPEDDPEDEPEEENDA